METKPVVVDAMGGDNAPEAIVAGAKLAAAQGINVVLTGPADLLKSISGGLEIWPASEVIHMNADGASAVRRQKDASVVRAAEGVRDGRACAMVGAGNTGATMASALLRMGRIKGVHRPAVATVIPKLEGSTILLDAGVNAECHAEWLVQFGQMGAAYASTRLGIFRPKVGLLSIGEEATKGTPLVKAAHEALCNPGIFGERAYFIGNVEGRDVMTEAVDVVVTDGFTGNVVLKTLEGASKILVQAVMGALFSSDDAFQLATSQLSKLGSLKLKFDSDTYGGSMLLGVDGICIISHGSASAEAILNAILLAQSMAQSNMVEQLAKAVALQPIPI